jgi:transcriptional regulator with XRE-family HTH domain
MLETSAACDFIVGSRIRLRRKQRGISQEHLAAVLGVSSREVEEFESGAVRVGAERLAAIGALLEAPISYFFEELGAVTSGADDQPADSVKAVSGTGELVSAYCRIASSQLRGAVLSFAQILARERGNRSRSLPGSKPAKRGRSRSRAR